MSHNTDYMTKMVKKASREASKDFKGWTRVVPVVKPSKKKSTKQYLMECE